uniref:Uncharacterized protein n=1 Tax=Bionectria ochroleuca TaxID=29856 RepID=A0A0B7KL49_BIOOC
MNIRDSSGRLVSLLIDDGAGARFHALNISDEVDKSLIAMEGLARCASRTGQIYLGQEARKTFDDIMYDLCHLEAQLQQITKQQRSAVEDSFTK